MGEVTQTEYVRRLRERAIPLPAQCARLPFGRRYTSVEWSILAWGTT